MLEEYVAEVRGEPIGCVVLVTRNDAGQWMLVLDIEGHRQADGTFDADMRARQHHFIPDVLAPFLIEDHLPRDDPPQPAPPRRRHPRGT